MKKILVVEDSATLRSDLAFLLRMEGFEVVTAGDGFEGLRKAEEFFPLDLILSDIRMPNMDGFDFLREWRRRRPDSSIPFIYITVLDSQNDIQKGRELGASGYIAKPINLDELLAIIRAQLELPAVGRGNL